VIGAGVDDDFHSSAQQAAWLAKTNAGLLARRELEMVRSRAVQHDRIKSSAIRINNDRNAMLSKPSRENNHCTNERAWCKKSAQKWVRP
jgi:hypothetical protein